ncbi:hypothetical protein QJQ45_003476 [Haematococcus lacustris]|nr:hypothetical protein QJQ45_003476 [Haematococcus lacustris]
MSQRQRVSHSVPALLNEMDFEKPALSKHWARWFRTGKLANKGFVFEKTVASSHTGWASPAGTSLETNLKHITVDVAIWDTVWEAYLGPTWVWRRLRLYGAQDRALEQYFKKLEEDMVELYMERHGRAKQMVVFFCAAGIGTRGGRGADAVLRACCKVVCRPRGTDQLRGRVVLVDEHHQRTTRVSSAVNGQQPCEEELDHEQPTRPAGWKPPAGQVEYRLLRPAWSQQRDQPVRGLMWCPIVAPRKPPQAPGSSQVATQPAASEPGPSTPPPAKHSICTQAEQAAELTQPTKGTGKAQGKAAKAKPAPQPGRWLDRDCNAGVNMQRIGESRWRPLELCWWLEQAALPAKGKEYPGQGYKRVRDRPPKAQQQQQPVEAQDLQPPGSTYREIGITRQAQATKTWLTQLKPQLNALSHVSSKPSSLASYRRFADTVLETYDAMWAEVSKPRWVSKRMKAIKANGARGSACAKAARQQDALMSAAAATEAELEEATSQLRSCQSVNMRTATDLQVCQERLHQSQQALQQSENEVLGLQVSLHRCRSELSAAKQELAACKSKVRSMGTQLAAMRAQLATAKRAMPKDVQDQ